MPFDQVDYEVETIIDYKARREGAVKIWNRVPQAVFCMNNWECGSIRCALGWLAAEGYDGWTFGERSPHHGRFPVAPNGKKAYSGAAEYFGITVAEATACFSETNVNKKFYKRWFGKLTMQDVSKALLAFPYA